MGPSLGRPVKALCGITLVCVATSGLAAQEGHEQHGEHLGHVRFPVSCTAEAQRWFEWRPANTYKPLAVYPSKLSTPPCTS